MLMKVAVDWKGVVDGRRADSVVLNWERSLVHDFVYYEGTRGELGGGGHF